jgi:hypothetical protein
MSKKQELIEFIKKAELLEADQKEWEELINSSPDEYVEGLWELFRKFPGEISWFNDLYKRKKEAFSIMKKDKAEGEALFQKIVQEEKEKLDKIVNEISN